MKLTRKALTTVALSGVLLAGAAVPAQAAATNTDNCTTGRAHTYCKSQAPRNCKTLTSAWGRTFTVCLSRAPRS